MKQKETIQGPWLPLQRQLKYPVAIRSPSLKWWWVKWSFHCIVRTTEWFFKGSDHLISITRIIRNMLYRRWMFCTFRPVHSWPLNALSWPCNFQRNPPACWFITVLTSYLLYIYLSFSLKEIPVIRLSCSFAQLYSQFDCLLSPFNNWWINHFGTKCQTPAHFVQHLQMHVHHIAFSFPRHQEQNPSFITDICRGWIHPIPSILKLWR